MRTDELRRYEMLQRVRAFGAAHSHLFPAGSGGAEALTIVSETVTRLSDHAAAKLMAATQGRPRKTLAREALETQVRTIARTARVLAEETPGFDSPFTIPQTLNDQRLVTLAGVFRTQAEPVRDRFVSLGLPATFVADLDAAIAEFVAAIGDRNAGRDVRMASGEAIRSELRAGSAAVRRMHAVVMNQAAGDPAVVAVWSRDRRVQQVGGGGRRPSSETPVPETPPTTPGSDTPGVAVGPGEQVELVDSVEPAPAVSAGDTEESPVTTDVPVPDVTDDTEPHAA